MTAVTAEQRSQERQRKIAQRKELRLLSLFFKYEKD
jgi:hypothetical protein